MKYKMLLSLVVEADSAEDMKAAAQKFRDGLPFLKMFDINVEDAPADATPDTRWSVINGTIDRVPLEVADIAALRDLQAPAGEVARIAGQKPVYAYTPKIAREVAINLDISRIVASNIEGIWIDVAYMHQLQQQQVQAMMQQQAQAQGRQPQRAPQNRR